MSCLTLCFHCIFDFNKAKFNCWIIVSNQYELLDHFQLYIHIFDPLLKFNNHCVCSIGRNNFDDQLSGIQEDIWPMVIIYKLIYRIYPSFCYFKIFVAINKTVCMLCSLHMQEAIENQIIGGATLLRQIVILVRGSFG